MRKRGRSRKLEPRSTGQQEELRFVDPGIANEECRLLASNLPQDVSSAELDAAFSRFGLLHEIIVYTAERYALLIFYVASEARRALRRLQHHKLRGTGTGMEIRQAGAWKGYSNGGDNSCGRTVRAVDENGIPWLGGRKAVALANHLFGFCGWNCAVDKLEPADSQGGVGKPPAPTVGSGTEKCTQARCGSGGGARWANVQPKSALSAASDGRGCIAVAPRVALRWRACVILTVQTAAPKAADVPAVTTPVVATQAHANEVMPRSCGTRAAGIVNGHSATATMAGAAATAAVSATATPSTAVVAAAADAVAVAATCGAVTVRGVGFGEHECDPGIAKKQAITDARGVALQKLRVLLIDGGRYRGGETRVSILTWQEGTATVATLDESEDDFGDLYGDVNADDAVKRHRAEEVKAGFFLPPVATMPAGWS